VAEPTCQRADGTTASEAWAARARTELGEQLPLRSGTGNRKGFDFEACTGAVSADLFDGAGGKQEWSKDGNGTFDLITFSFGGNDVGFKEYLYECLGISPADAEAAAKIGFVSPVVATGAWATTRGCPSDAEARVRIGLLGSGGFDRGGRHVDDYPTFLRRVANEVARPGANVVVVGYPELMEDPEQWPAVNKATRLCQGIRADDARRIRGLAGDLNATIGQAVATVDGERPNGVSFTFVDINSGDPAHGVDWGDQSLYEPNSGPRHNLCSSDQWINGLTTGITDGKPRIERSFHPTQKGHDATGRLVAARIRGLDWSRLRSDVDVRSFDYKNVDYPAGSCRSDNWTNPKPIPVRNGEGTSGSKSDDDDLDLQNPVYTYAEMYVGGPVGYADFNGDGVEDVLVSVTCGAGGTYMDEFALPLTVEDDHLAILGGKPLTQVVGKSRGGVLSRILKGSTRLDGTTIVVDEMYQVADDEPQCCYTGKATVRWRWTGGGFEAQVPETPGSKLNPNSLSTDGIEPLRFGDPLSKAEQLTGKKAQPGCGGGYGREYIQDARPGLSLFFVDGAFEGYSTSSGEYSTLSGVRPGMAVGEAQRRIPSAVRRVIANNADALVVTSGGVDVVFVISNERIAYIEAGKNLAQNGEFC